MPHVLSTGYFLRDLTVLLLSLAIVIMLLTIEKSVKRNLRVSYFTRVFNLLIGAFLLVVVAELIGVLLRTSVLYGNETYAIIRSILLTIGALLLFLSSVMLYLPFARGQYVIVPIATEPSQEIAYGAYWGRSEATERLFVELTKHRHLPGIAVTRDPPEVFRSRLGLKIVPVLWVSKVRHDEAVDPTRLPYLLENLKAFLESTNLDKVILIDCVEYLLLENKPESVLKFIASLRDLATLNRGILLVSIEREALDEKTFNMLVSELKPVEELEKMLSK
ncbi:conserved membrane protein of unknown function [Thermococcus nautili]|uniref:DUF835 domain-containing protein n=2 Tax=Thermococcus nautili TaxID=195522 RepID=UPI0025579996|nr:DUF835 domain-containing protein [Thermococcus nautili]CAI1492829.1 conserved membrane protein of unknown function [Thermococcus nautili]